MLNTYPCNPFPPSSEQMGAGGGSAYELPIASADELGGVKVGSGLSIDESGTLSNDNATPYALPTAGADTLGGVKVGSGLSIDENGVLSTSGGGGTTIKTVDINTSTDGNGKIPNLLIGAGKYPIGVVITSTADVLSYIYTSAVNAFGVVCENLNHSALASTGIVGKLFYIET